MNCVGSNGTVHVVTQKFCQLSIWCRHDCCQYSAGDAQWSRCLPCYRFERVVDCSSVKQTTDDADVGYVRRCPLFLAGKI